MQGLVGYHSISTDVPSRHQGRLAVLYWGYPRFVLKSYQQHFPYAIIFQMASDWAVMVSSGVLPVTR